MTVPRDHEPFLRAILDRPADDLPRLVFADYLEEAGDADRAEFIRLQCELAAGVADPLRRAALEAREEALQKTYREAWRVPIRGHQTFRRGFVDTLWTTADILLAAPAETVAGSTVRTLRITNADQRIDGLAEYPGFARIEHLDLTNNNLAGDYRLRSILSNPHLARLRGLNLHNNRIWADDVLRLASSPVAERLTHLDLSGNAVGEEGVAHIVSEPNLLNLESLNLRSDGLPTYECLDGGAATWLAGASFRRLRHLDLAGQRIGEAGLIALGQACDRWSLVRLDVSDNDLGTFDHAVSHAFFLRPGNRALRTVDYGRNSLSMWDAENLLRWDQLPRMDRFSLAKCLLVEPVRLLLGASRFAPKLHIDVPGFQLVDEDNP